MKYYVVVSNQTIHLIPRWKNRLSDEFLTDKEYLEEISNRLFENEFIIPLAKFNINKVPQKVTIQYGNKEYDKLSELVDIIYNSRSYAIEEESAKKRIRSLAIKSMLQKTKLYGREISYRFDFIDASNYRIIY